MDNNIKLRMTYLPLITQRVCGHLCGHSLLVEDPQLTLIVNFYQLLAASGGIRDIELKEQKKYSIQREERQ